MQQLNEHRPFVLGLTFFFTGMCSPSPSNATLCPGVTSVEDLEVDVEELRDADPGGFVAEAVVNGRTTEGREAPLSDPPR